MSSSSHKWQGEAACRSTNLESYFDDYENDTEPFDIRTQVDVTCIGCPVVRTCLVYGKYYRLTGVWGGVYLLDGDMDPEMNQHKTPDNWAQLYASITK